MDFSEYPVSGEYYGGSEKKIGLTIDGNEYMILSYDYTTVSQDNQGVLRRPDGKDLT